MNFLTTMKLRALILVDLQNDFLPGGALAVPCGDEAVAAANRAMIDYDCVVATQDWHPQDHLSFACNHPEKQPYEVIELAGISQTLWPAHAVQGTYGADFSETLDISRVRRVFQKGMHRDVDSYSGFYDNGRHHSTGLAEWLRSHGVRDVAVCGLATDYCVKWTVLDALMEGFSVTVLTDACRAVNVSTGDGVAAFDAMLRAGARLR